MEPSWQGPNLVPWKLILFHMHCHRNFWIYRFKFISNRCVASSNAVEGSFITFDWFSYWWAMNYPSTDGFFLIFMMWLINLAWNKEIFIREYSRKQRHACEFSEKGQYIWNIRQKCSKFENILKKGWWLHVIIARNKLLQQSLFIERKMKLISWGFEKDFFNFHRGFFFEVRSKKLCTFAITRTSSLKRTHPKLFFSRICRKL